MRLRHVAKCHRDQSEVARQHSCPFEGEYVPQRENPRFNLPPPSLTFLHHLILVGRDEPRQTAGQQHANQLLAEGKRERGCEVTELTHF